MIQIDTMRIASCIPDIIGYLVDRDHVSTGIVLAACIWLPLTRQELIEHEVHFGVGDHVDVWYQREFGLTSRLGQVAQ